MQGTTELQDLHRETEEMPEVTERTLERGLNKRTGESEGSNEGYGERFFNRSIGSIGRAYG